MKTTRTIIGLILSIGSIFAQAPKVYINFVSHNEPGDNLQTSFPFNKMAPKVLQLASIIDAKGASWNLETCDGFAKGALNFQGATSNVFRTLEQPPYSDNMEIDPRNKQTLYPTIADLFHILDSLGANPTKTLGGFIYSSTTSTLPDWFQYQDTIQGVSYPNVKWKCNLMWGAGSIPPHDNDLNDYGIWMPDATNNFYNHNSNRSIWFIGNGCQPILALDSIENPQDIIAPLKYFLDSIQNGLLPQDKFYVYSITINQSHFGPMLFQKISTICDSINSWGTNKIQWATLTQKLDSFAVWQQTPNDYSQWLCGQTSTGMEDFGNINTSYIYPNPFSLQTVLQSKISLVNATLTIQNCLGQTVKQIKNISGQTVILHRDNLISGLYFISLTQDNKIISTDKLIITD